MEKIPFAGEHSEKILSELGYSTSETEELKKLGVI
jgi:crotonobetainyl-CoA:carnitine CoA-transferase CaiB-like acyl-CoA transferase